MSIAQLKQRYGQVQVAKRKFLSKNPPKFSPTVKYIQHSLSLIEARAILKDQSVSFSDRCTVSNLLEIIERKINFHYKHKDFNLAVATAQLKQARKLLKI